MHVSLSKLLNFLIGSFCPGHPEPKRWFVNSRLSLYYIPNVFNMIELLWSRRRRIRPERQCKFLMFLSSLSISGYFVKTSIPGKPRSLVLDPLHLCLSCLPRFPGRPGGDARIMYDDTLLSRQSIGYYWPEQPGLQRFRGAVGYVRGVSWCSGVAMCSGASFDISGCPWVNPTFMASTAESCRKPRSRTAVC